jgi:hypothetical protein
MSNWVPSPNATNIMVSMPTHPLVPCLQYVLAHTGEAGWIRIAKRNTSVVTNVVNDRASGNPYE